MKKIITTILCAVFALGVFAGCTQEETVLIASSAGQLAAATWIASESPDQATITEVVQTLGEIERLAATLEGTATNGFVVALYPLVVEYLAEQEIDPEMLPLIQAASQTLLVALDTLFIMNPNLFDDQAEAIKAVKAFISGARYALSLNQDSPQMRQLQKQAETVEKALQSKVSCTHQNCNCIEPIVA